MGDVLKQKDQRQQMTHLLDALELNQVCDRDVENLSGAFLQDQLISSHPPLPVLIVTQSLPDILM